MNPRESADLEACEAILRKGSKSFYAASRVLPLRVRRPAMALYAFCRAADDAVDDAEDVISVKRRAVERLRERLDRVYAARSLDGVVERAFSTVVSEFKIPRSLPDALVEGMQWDAEGRHYETLDDVVAYSARVASSVGAMMTILMGPRGETVLARACDLGVAMQLTNISRDVGEDARMGRLYLPAEWMEEEGISPSGWLRNPGYTPNVARVVERLLRHADTLYAQADLGIPMLPRDCRVAIKAARLIYSDIGRVIARRGYDSVSSRAVVSKGRKIWLLLRSFGALVSSPGPQQIPALAPVKFLVDAARVELP